MKSERDATSDVYSPSKYMSIPTEKSKELGACPRCGTILKLNTTGAIWCPGCGYTNSLQKI